jgi:hypothetical protein
MNVYVHLNDISNMTTPAVMEWRVNHAFGTDGTDFWQNFFFCDEAHEDERVIYLFTEYQLEFLWNWWNKKYKASDKNTQLKLQYSRQKLFHTAKTAPNGKLVNRMYVGYINSHEHHLKIERVFFGVPPHIIKETPYSDFFAGRFRGGPAGNTLTREECGEQLKRLEKMRTEIEKVFRSHLKKNEKWLRYLGPDYIDLGYIAYCSGINSNCPGGRHECICSA